MKWINIGDNINHSNTRAVIFWENLFITVSVYALVLVPPGQRTCYWQKDFLYYGISFNSSPPSATYMRQWIGSALVQIMAWRLFGAKPFPEPMPGWTFKNKLQWNSNRGTKLFIHENALEYIVCEMAVILSRGWIELYVASQCRDMTENATICLYFQKQGSVQNGHLPLYIHNKIYKH